MAYYSIIFASLKKVTQEKVSLGLLLFDDNKVLSKFSRTKLSALRQLMNKDDYALLSNAVHSLQKTAIESGERVNVNNNSLFRISDTTFTTKYIDYLSRYKNNLLTYTPPKSIDIAVDEENAIKLFDNLVGSEIINDNPIIVKAEPIDKLVTSFNKKVNLHFNRDYTITRANIPDLMFPVRVDLAGRNGQDVIVQSVNMTGSQNNIIREISSFYLLKDMYRKNHIPVQDFLLSEEPPSSLKKQHELWKEVAHSDSFNYIDVSESQRIIEYAEANQVVPIQGHPSSDEENDADYPF